MRAATIREKRDPDRGASRSDAGTGEVLVRVRAAGLNGGDMMQRRGLYPAPPGSPRTSRGWSSRARSRPRGRCRAVRAGRARDGDRRRRGPGGAVRGPRAPLMPVPARPRLAGGRRPAGGLHDRARCDLHAGGAALGRAPARARRRRRRGHRRDPARERGGARVTATVRDEQLRGQVEALGARVIACRGLRRARPIRRDPRVGRRAQHAREPAGARHRRARRA